MANDMKNCPKCGIQARGTYRFCPECGGRLAGLRVPSADLAEDGDSGSQVRADTHGGPPTAMETGNSEAEAGQRALTPKVKNAPVLVALALLFGSIGYFALGPFSPPSTAPSATLPPDRLQVLQDAAADGDPAAALSLARIQILQDPESPEAKEAEARMPELEAAYAEAQRGEREAAEEAMARQRENRRLARIRDEEAQARQAAVQLEQKWRYGAREDAMTGRVTRTARIDSENTVNFGFPYQGAQRATLTIQHQAGQFQNIVFRIERGQLLCYTHDRCSVRIRFDEGNPTTWRGAPPRDQSTEVLFIRAYGDFLQRLRNAERVRIQPEVYQEGSPVFEFLVGGFRMERYQGG